MNRVPINSSGSFLIIITYGNKIAFLFWTISSNSLASIKLNEWTSVFRKRVSVHECAAKLEMENIMIFENSISFTCIMLVATRFRAILHERMPSYTCSSWRTRFFHLLRNVPSENESKTFYLIIELMKFHLFCNQTERRARNLMIDFTLNRKIT